MSNNEMCQYFYWSLSRSAYLVRMLRGEKLCSLRLICMITANIVSFKHQHPLNQLPCSTYVHFLAILYRPGPFFLLSLPIFYNTHSEAGLKISCTVCQPMFKENNKLQYQSLEQCKNFVFEYNCYSNKSPEAIWTDFGNQ